MDSNIGFPTPNNNSSNRLVRSSPLPPTNWGDPYEIWESMIIKDDKYKRDPNLLIRHPNLDSRMRSILIDWLSEVSQEFRLHRESFYLAVDFIDRYLSIHCDIPRNRLQLIGITSLFIAAKIEEIHPPELPTIAHITDGACSKDDIIEEELVIMQSLNWSLCPVTVNKWLSVFLQIYSVISKQDNKDPNARSSGDAFLVPNYNSSFFAQIAHLIDLCMLDIGCLAFDYDIIAASAFYHFTNEKTVYECTRLNLSDIGECVIWMTPFAMAARDSGYEEPDYKNTDPNWSNMQYHSVDLALLEKAFAKRKELVREDESSESLICLMPPSPVSSPNVTKAKRARRRSSRTPSSNSPSPTNINLNKSSSSKRKRSVPLTESVKKRRLAIACE